MKYTVENNGVKLTADTLGAELVELQVDGKEKLWQNITLPLTISPGTWAFPKPPFPVPFPAKVALAQKHDFLIVEDRPYRELRYEGEHIPTMYSLDPDRVIHLGSFSKIFAPGFRLGWAIAHPHILDKIYVCKQSLDLCPPIFDQYVAAEFLSSGRLDANLEKSIALYKDKRDHLLSLLQEYMPEGVRWTHPEGGLFLFLTMLEGFEAVKFYDKALDAGVAYVAGEFFHPDGNGKNTMRMNFSFMAKERMTEGVKILAELLAKEISPLPSVGRNDSVE